MKLNGYIISLWLLIFNLRMLDGWKIVISITIFKMIILRETKSKLGFLTGDMFCFEGWTILRNSAYFAHWFSRLSGIMVLFKV